MNPFRSIRWTLQIWHASLLALVLVGFGTASYYGISRMRYQEVDGELERVAHQLAASMMHQPGRPPFDGPPGRGGPPNGRGGDFRGPDPRDMGPPPDDRGGRRNRGGRPPPIEVPPSLAGRFGDITGGDLYYISWGMFGEMLDTSVSPAEQLTIPIPPAQDDPDKIAPLEPRQRGDLREVYVYGPFNTRVLVGRSVAHEQVAMRHLAILLGAIGMGVMLVGLAGGWLVSARAIRPIQAITHAAQDISATNLSRRIDVAAAQSELGTLAAVLNDMFARLDAAFQQQVRFTADASHELRTPLSVIHTHSQLALSRERSAEEYRKTIETSLRASNRMKGLVDSLLLLAGADAGRLKIDRQPMDLRDVADDCVTMLAPLADEKKVTIESNLNSASMLGDSSRIAQVIINLLTNAIRYNREGGTVGVSVKSEQSQAVLKISDTGMGISAEHVPHLFERFYRVDVARSREAGGSGLGLAICKSIVEAHGGTISVQSEPQKGTTFTVRLPAGG